MKYDKHGAERRQQDHYLYQGIDGGRTYFSVDNLRAYKM